MWHRLGDIVVYIVMPSSILLTGVLLLVYGVALQLHTGDAAGWQIIVMSAILTLVSLMLLVLVNTRRARQRRECVHGSGSAPRPSGSMPR